MHYIIISVCLECSFIIYLEVYVESKAHPWFDPLICLSRTIECALPHPRMSYHRQNADRRFVDKGGIDEKRVDNIESCEDVDNITGGNFTAGNNNDLDNLNDHSKRTCGGLGSSYKEVSLAIDHICGYMTPIAYSIFLAVYFADIS